MIFGPANGPPFVRVNGERRDGTMADLEQLLKLTDTTDALYNTGAQHPRAQRKKKKKAALDGGAGRGAGRLTGRGRASPHPKMPLATASAWARLPMEAAAVIETRPVMFGNVNVNSPMHFDVRMLEGLLTEMLTLARRSSSRRFC